MKTVLVVYTKLKEVTDKELKTLARFEKKYAFVAEDLKVGDIIESPDYTSNMLVVKTLTKVYKYYDSVTGKMSNTFNSTKQWEIRELILQPKKEEAVYYNKVN